MNAGYSEHRQFHKLNVTLFFLITFTPLLDLCPTNDDGLQVAEGKSASHFPSSSPCTPCVARPWGKVMYTFALSHHFSRLQNTERHRQRRCFSIIQCATSCAVDTGPEHLALAPPARSAVPSESTSGPFINMETRATISRSLTAAAHQIKMCGAHRDLIILPIGRPLEQKGKHAISFCLIAQTDTHSACIVPEVRRGYQTV